MLRANTALSTAASAATGSQAFTNAGKKISFTDTAKLEAQLDTLICEVQSALPETKILLMAPFILRAAATDDSPDLPNRFSSFYRGVREIAERMQNLAAKRDVAFLDLQSAFEEAAKAAEPSYWLADGVHPTIKGHELIKRELLKNLKEIEV